MRKSSRNAEGLAAFALLCWLGSVSLQGQQPKLQDVPATGVMPPERPAANALESTPLDPAVRASVREALAKRDYTRAEALLLGEIERNPKSPQLLTLVGGIFFQDGKYLNTAIAMKKAEALAPLDDSNRFTLAMAYIELNHRDWARPELEKLAQSNPQNPLYPYWLSRLDYDAMQFNAAVARLRKALELNPAFVRAYDNLGLCYEALGKYDEAIQAYQDALRLNREKTQNSPWPAMNLGALLVKLGKLSDAETYLREALRLNPKFPQARYQLGLLLEKQKKDDEALEELQQAAALNPAYPEPHYLMGKIYRSRGDAKRSDEEWATFQKLKKEQPNERPR